MVVLAVAVQTKPVQQWLVERATTKLSKALGTKVSVKSVDFSLFYKANINGVFVADKKQDTILYAGNINVSITNWFFLKDKTDLKYLGLEDAIIKMKRTDSVWNYQYIVDYFSSPKSTTQSQPNNNFQLKEIQLKNIKLIKNDEWRGEIITVLADDLLVKTDSLNFVKNKLYFNNITVDKPYVNIQKFKGNRPVDYVFPIEVEKIDKNPLQVFINKIAIENGTLAINHIYGNAAPGFDGEHILFTPLNVNLNNFQIHKDTLTADLSLNANERSGLQIKSLNAKFKWMPRLMELKQLDLVTNKSHITNYYAMRFKNFDDDFDEYNTNVTMDAHFKNSIINSDDVAFFAPALKTWKKELQLSCNFLGTVSQFKSTNFFAKEKGNTTTIEGSLAMTGLPNIHKTIIEFNDGKIKTNYKDLSAIVPSLKGINTPNLTALGEINFVGNFNGTIDKFLTNGIINTSLGNMSTNVAMDLTKQDALYKGDLSVNNFELGKFLRDDNLGIIDFKGKFDGKSFSVARLNTKLEGSFSKLGFNGYTYTNINTNGIFHNKYFNGELKSNDPNFYLNGQAEADFSKPIPKFNILADITKSNLQALSLAKEPLHFTGLLDLNFTGTNIDNFLGSAKLFNAAISNNISKITFDSLSLSTDYKDSTKYLHFASNDFNVDVAGKFKILDLPNSFQSFLHNYYPSYIAAPASLAANQQFKVKVTTGYIEPYLNLFDKNIKGFNDASLSGNIDTRNNLFSVNLNLPFGQYKNYVATGVELNGKGNKNSLNLLGNVSEFKFTDSLNFPNSTFTINSANDVSTVSLKTRATNTLNEADLNAVIETSPNTVKVKFNPSSFILNNKTWTLDKEGEITLSKNLTEAHNVKFIQGFQEIMLETKPVDGGNTSDMDIKFKDVVGGDIVSLFVKKTKVEAITNGTIHIDDIFGKMNATADLTLTELRVDDDSIGLATIKSNYNSRTGIVQSTIQSNNPNYDFLIDGTVNVNDATTPINTNIQLHNTKIDFVQKLIGTDVFSNLTGFANGSLQVVGTANQPQLLGKVKLLNAGLKVNYTQVYYKIDSANLSFEENGIDFGDFEIKDTLGYTGSVRGKLYEKNFQKLFFDFDLSTNKLLLLNTTAINNSSFYGNVTGQATLRFKGPEDNCKMTLTGEANEESHITIPNATSKESNMANFIVFKPIGVEMIDDRKKTNFNLLVDLDVLANNKVEFGVVIDDVNGDIIKARGNGRLRMKAGTNDAFDMRGKYNIEEGSYNYNFQSLIRKPFVLKKGDNSYIEWNGDPYDANIHIDAMYEAKNVSIKDLVGNAQTSFSSASRGFNDVYVVATLSGRLMKPDIKFKFDFPVNSPIKNDDVFDRFRKKIESDENEMLKQVAYLIMFNSFAPYGEASVAQTNFTSIGVNSISSIITREINKSVTNLLQRITNDKSLLFDLSSAVYSSNDLFNNGNINATSTQFDRYNLKFKLGKSFFSDKVRVNFGSDFDFNLRSATTQTGNFQWLPDWNVEWSLNKDNNILLLVFSKNSLDISGSTLGRRNRQGVGITYKKDFNKSPFEKKDADMEFKK